MVQLISAYSVFAVNTKTPSLSAVNNTLLPLIFRVQFSELVILNSTSVSYSLPFNKGVAVIILLLPTTRVVSSYPILTL